MTGGYQPSYVEDLSLPGLIELVGEIRRVDATRRHQLLSDMTAATRGEPDDLRRAYGRLAAEAGLTPARQSAGNVNDLARALGSW